MAEHASASRVPFTMEGEAPSGPRARKENEKTPLALLRNNLRQLETGVLDHFDVLFVALTAGGQVTLREH